MVLVVLKIITKSKKIDVIIKLIVYIKGNIWYKISIVKTIFKYYEEDNYLLQKIRI